jgi:UDP-2,3-diacylglucosamine pyrophosphatase LpxH
MQRATRLFVISDLHLGGDAPAMMSFPQELADFIDGLPGRTRPDEAIELVIAGDVIDFLAIELDGQTDAWTSEPARAVAKLRKAIGGPEAVVYEALAKHIAAGHGLTILVGNHDLELALPDIQSALCEALKCRPGAIHFVDDGRAWRLGGALVEHGNRYDDANLNDWNSLREIAASQSRGEAPLSELEPSFGSQLVHKVVHKYKQSFEFIDTLQPQGVLVAYLMAALEPGLLEHLPALLKVWRGQSRQARNADGAAPKNKTSRGGAVRTAVAPDEVFGPEMDTSRLDLLFGLAPAR